MYYQIEKDVIIVKVGTNVLANTATGIEALDERSFRQIGREVRGLADRSMGIILVSSGAITAGVLGDKRRREDIENVFDLQRYAARGWDQVVQRWKQSIGSERVSSTLLTKREIHTDAMRTKALGVMSYCLAHGDVFVVNENDTISDDEIRFGDNDTLAAVIAVECARAGLFRSVKMVLLTNINGLRADKDDETTLIRSVNDITSIEHYAGGTDSGHSRGGMATKVRAARSATEVGVETFIADGRVNGAIGKALVGKIGTHFTSVVSRSV